jgi:hypothetical protein
LESRILGRGLLVAELLYHFRLVLSVLDPRRKYSRLGD